MYLSKSMNRSMEDIWCWLGLSKPTGAHVSHSLKLKTLDRIKNNSIGREVKTWMPSNLT